MEISNQTKNRTTLSSNSNTPGYLEHPKSTYPTELYTSIFTEALFAIVKVQSQSKSPVANEYMYTIQNIRFYSVITGNRAVTLART